eukprot:3899411-Lingulodinium_polyedra.AAC.1
MRVSPFERGVMRRARRACAVSWRARGVCACAVLRRAEAAERAFDRVSVQRFARRRAAMRSNARSAVA